MESTESPICRNFSKSDKSRTIIKGFIISLILLLQCVVIGVNIKETCPNNITFKQTGEIKVSASHYFAKSKQTDSTPLITASSRKIDTNKLKVGELKWVALSRDFLKPHNKQALFDYGDTIKVTGIGTLSGLYLIADCMAARYKNKIDILVHHKRNFKHFEKAKIHYEKDTTIKIKR